VVFPRSDGSLHNARNYEGSVSSLVEEAEFEEVLIVTFVRRMKHDRNLSRDSFLNGFGFPSETSRKPRVTLVNYYLDERAPT